jgi:DNA polymerase-3 subunit alpha (Gram-positive type)
MTRGIDLARAKIRELQASQKQEQKAKDEDLLTTLEACYEFYLRGFTFTAIDLFESDPVKFTIVGENALRPPFVAVSGLGETAARDLARQRVGREFISIEDIGAACPKVSKTHIEQLKSLGVFRDLPDASQLSLF